MKAAKLLTLFLSLGLSVVFLSNCGGDEETESCAEDEVCSTSVTACCDDVACVYKYNGKEYTEDQLDQLTDDIGCTGGIKIIDGESTVSLNLKTLMNRAKIGRN